MQYDDQHSDSLYDRHEAQHSAKALFRDGAKAMENADFDKPVKVFGLFNVDAGLAAYATMAYNVGSDYATRVLTPKTYDLTKRFASPHMSSNATLRTAALTTTAMNVVLKSGGYFTPMINTLKEGREERTKLARRISPVLDEMVGKHSVSALNVAAKQNTLIKAHLVRMNKQQGVARSNNLIDLIVNAGPNLALNYNQMKGMWAGQHPRELEAAAMLKAQADAEKPAQTEVSAGGELKEMGKLFVQGGTGAFTDRIKKSNLHKLNKTLRPYSALEMIETLQEQFEANPKSRSYQVPGKRAESYNLEEYLARVAIHHYAEVADYDTEFSEIREALHEDLAHAVKPIAEAMRKGEFDAMGFVRLLGEGKLVQKGGRVIAGVEEIRELIGTQSAGHGAHHQSAEEHFAKAPYNRDEFKKALHALEGDDQRIFASLFSNEVLEDAGIKPAKIKEWRDATAAKHDADLRLAEGALGIAAEGVDAMRHEGVMSSKEIATLQHGVQKIQRDGVDAVHALRGSATNAHGIEQTVANAAVAKVLKNAASFKDMITKGREQLNDNEQSFADREDHRRAAYGEREV